MNEDRELLELAAFAVGIAPVIRFQDGGLVIGPRSRQRFWSPLLDDGDALRLAVIVGSKMFKGNGVVLSFADSEDKTVVFRDYEDIRATEDSTNEPLAATRRAIVRAAASIGKKMKEQGE